MEAADAINSKVEMRKDVLQFYRNRRKTMEEREKTVLKNLVLMVRKRSKSQSPSTSSEKKGHQEANFRNSVDYSGNESSARNK